MRFFLCAAGLLALSACSSAVPDSAAGVGESGTFQSEREARDARLAGTMLPSPTAISSEPLGTEPPQSGDASDLVAETQAALREQAMNSGEPVLHADPSNPPPQTVTTSDGQVMRFEVDSFKKHCLINGLDDIGLTMENAPAIDAFETAAAQSRPWI